MSRMRARIQQSRLRIPFIHARIWLIRASIRFIRERIRFIGTRTRFIRRRSRFIRRSIRARVVPSAPMRARTHFVHAGIGAMRTRKRKIVVRNSGMNLAI